MKDFISEIEELVSKEDESENERISYMVEKYFDVDLYNQIQEALKKAPKEIINRSNEIYYDI